jgi:hypothetical protein
VTVIEGLVDAERALRQVRISLLRVQRSDEPAGPAQEPDR